MVVSLDLLAYTEILVLFVPSVPFFACPKIAGAYPSPQHQDCRDSFADLESRVSLLLFSTAATISG